MSASDLALGASNVPESLIARVRMRILGARGWILASVMVACLSTGLIHQRLYEPLYNATTLLAIAPEHGPDGTPVPQTKLSLNTEAAVLRSTLLVQRTVTALDLTRDTEFAGHVRHPAVSMLARLGSVATPPAAIRDGAARQRQTTQRLQRRITVRLLPDSQVLSLTVATRDPAKSSRIANHLAWSYLADRAKAQRLKQTIWSAFQPPLKTAMTDADLLYTASDIPAASPAALLLQPWSFDRILSPATDAAPQTLTSLPALLLAAGLIGLLLPSVGIAIHEAFYTRFRTADELEAATGLPVLGQIPELSDRRRDPLDYAMRKPSSLLSEAVRDLRTSVLQGPGGTDPRVIVVTSSVPHEGKSTTSAMLAQNLAAWGRKVLLIEADIRRQTFSRMFDIQNQRGILSVLAGLTTMEDAVIRPDGMSIDVLVGEASSTNAADILATHRFAAFLQTARQTYDYIIIDTPPVLVVTDARVITPWADAVLYAVHWESTPREQVSRGLQELRNIGVHPSGLILSRVNQKRMERYGYERNYGPYAQKSHYYIG